MCEYVCIEVNKLFMTILTKRGASCASTWQHAHTQILRAQAHARSNNPQHTRGSLESRMSSHKFSMLPEPDKHPKTIHNKHAQHAPTDNTQAQGHTIPHILEVPNELPQLLWVLPEAGQRCALRRIISCPDAVAGVPESGDVARGRDARARQYHNLECCQGSKMQMSRKCVCARVCM